MARKVAERQTRQEPRGSNMEIGQSTPASGDGNELLDMDQAISLLKTTRPTFYRWLRSGKIKGMKVGRQWRFYRQDVERFLKGEQPRIALPADIEPLTQQLRVLAGLGESARSKADPATAAVDAMIAAGVRMRASDIHIMPMAQPDTGRTEAAIRLRVDGVLHTVACFDIRLLPAVIERWKIMASLDPHEKRTPQDGRLLAKVDGKEYDLRASFVPTVLGDSVTLRILDRERCLLTLDQIDFAPRDRERLLRWLNAPWGLIVNTGPTGSGKTTVMYACVSHTVSSEVKVMSVEDPVEYLIPGVVQVQVREEQGLTFGRVMRQFLRSDPDIILVGEIRDREVLELCMQAALTGHLALTSLHAEDAVAALRRMVDIGCPAFLVSDAVRLVSAQRLVRVLCPDCSVPTNPSSELLARAEQWARAGGLGWDGLSKQFRKAVGCEKCGHTGYRGRTLVAEFLEVTPELGAAIRRDASGDQLRSIAVSQGMTTMAGDGVRRAAAGQTSLDEIARVLALQ